ncbi:hypothetical protein CRG98_017964 [Punica granatum]|uniref:Uncharacterized protein n=1 Tax=Punica granatum TaxID=22663 RepID=A0A2I0JZG8_PUNGR|nr:hypothetical protein CRG98_017964 [Punica granatum]
MGGVVTLSVGIKRIPNLRILPISGDKGLDSSHHPLIEKDSISSTLGTVSQPLTLPWLCRWFNPSPTPLPSLPATSVELFASLPSSATNSLHRRIITTCNNKALSLVAATPVASPTMALAHLPEPSSPPTSDTHW